MNKKSIIAKVLNKKVIRDYTYTILFLFISSFFAFFAIRPALKIAFSLRKEADELRLISRQYESNIAKIVNLQTLMEQVRDGKDLLTVAVPETPQLVDLVDQVKSAADSQGIVLEDFSIGSVQLHGDKQSSNLKSISLQLQTNGKFEQVIGVFNQVLNQQRLKTIREMSITRDKKSASSSGILKVEMDLEGYFFSQ